MYLLFTSNCFVYISIDSFVALLVRFSEITPTTVNAFEGENSEFTCNLLGGSNNVSITSEWSISTQSENFTIVGNTSDDFIVLPPNNSRLIIVRHDRATFDRATITCRGGLNATGINAQLFVNRKCIHNM